MQGLRPGLCGQKEMTVEEKDLSSVTGNIGAKVLSTHCLVLLVELASRSVVENLPQRPRWARHSCWQHPKGTHAGPCVPEPSVP